jgi:hypothetical protein
MPSTTEEDSSRNITEQAETASQQRRQLAVRPHHRPNLFVRLPRQLVAEFAKQVATQRSVFSEDIIEFLALEITTEDGACIYVSYNGGVLPEATEWSTGTCCLS